MPFSIRYEDGGEKTAPTPFPGAIEAGLQGQTRPLRIPVRRNVMISPKRLYRTADGRVTEEVEQGVSLLVAEGAETDDPLALEYLGVPEDQRVPYDPDTSDFKRLLRNVPEDKQMSGPAKADALSDKPVIADAVKAGAPIVDAPLLDATENDTALEAGERAEMQKDVDESAPKDEPKKSTRARRE